MAKILVVEDEEKLRISVEKFLISEGFTVCSADNGMDAVKKIKAEIPDLMILDIMLPELSGIQVCQIVRQDSDTPIIIVTALGSEEDILTGLGKGADDYIVKPFRMRELVARIQAVLRRRLPAQFLKKVLYLGELTIDLETVRLLKNGNRISLTPTEFRLLSMLAKEPGRAFTRLQLLEGAIGESYENYERVIDTHIFNLRRKIESNRGKPRYIETVFGIGYRFGDTI
ncbi:Transcriptional regulatory protein BaeR [Sporomusa silvacetica DSM 10669]|uniref:Transcriptional regulatory protein BaeR n=1 Tax=Sporomusa silvacetica DSM 10669 TaxID=1123289 RepID=A0ABZ3IJN0_9FIRM|nr:response regulator transcription factor [Sporomusa silvacetica]OZC18391.1 transcriptional regulatory protein BaeR [Sporomusa silvacetica DSM 10669]